MQCEEISYKKAKGQKEAKLINFKISYIKVNVIKYAS